jgi:uncharacterized protein (TIGR03032 family)
LGAWLQSQGLSLAFSTYRANRLIFLGTAEPAAGQKDPDQPSDAPQLKLHERLFDRPMGLFVAGESLWMATRCQIWRLDNLLGPGQLHEGGDRLYVPAASFTTGDVNVHEVMLGQDGQPIFVNTAFSCLATVAQGCSFAPTWQPPFITKLAGDDRCHLNGIALKDGIPTWATACGGSGEPSSWRNNRSDGGVLIHIPSGELTATGLSMPHSPRWHEGKLWLLNSGTGELGWIEDGHFQTTWTSAPSPSLRSCRRHWPASIWWGWRETSAISAVRWAGGWMPAAAALTFPSSAVPCATARPPAANWMSTDRRRCRCSCSMACSSPHGQKPSGVRACASIRTLPFTTTTSISAVRHVAPA